MDSRKIVLLVGALIVAAITAFMARTLLAGSATPRADAQSVQMATPSGPEVLVATKPLPVGTILDPTMLRYQPWPKDLVQNAYYLRKNGFDPKTLVGTVVRTEVTAGQPLTQGALVHPGDRGFLAAALGPGMRAVTVPVSSQPGFVFPGDRIDLVLTQAVPGGGDGPPLKVSETILRNIRVLATDQRTDNQVDENGKTKVITFSTVTLEATPKVAEQVSVAQTLGSISISLRPLADSASELEEAIASGDVKVPEGNDPKAEKAMIQKIASQPIAGRSTFATGADVSRFQRSTVPGKPPANGTGGPSGPVQNLGGAGSAPFPGGAVPTGPVVRIARGNTVTITSVGGKN
jgi:pilus assembly protein CpaB